MLKRDGNEIPQAELLADHETQIRDGELTQRNAVQAMRVRDDVRLELRLAPVLVLKLPQCFGMVELAHGGKGLNQRSRRQGRKTIRNHAQIDHKLNQHPYA